METPFDAGVTRLLAFGGAVLIVVIVAMTVIAWRRQPDLPISLRVALRIGFLTLCASLVTGAVVIAKGLALVYSGRAEAAYLTGGGLKPIHGVLMHGVLVLPLFAWCLSFVEWSERRRLEATLAAAAAYLLLATAVTVKTIAGLP